MGIYSCMGNQLRARSYSDRLTLSTTSNLSVSVDKRDAIRLRRNNTKILVALCKKIEMKFTGLSFNGIAKMKQYL